MENGILALAIGVIRAGGKLWRKGKVQRNNAEVNKKRKLSQTHSYDMNDLKAKPVLPKAMHPI